MGGGVEVVVGTEAIVPRISDGASAQVGGITACG